MIKTNAALRPLFDKHGSLDDDLRSWAAEKLSLALTATPAEVDRAFVRMLTNEASVPPREVHFAREVLRRPSGESVAWASQPGTWSAAYDAFLSDRESQLRQQIESFAALYFELPPAERRRAWQSLGERVEGCPALVRRLAALERALNVSLPDSDELDEEVQALLNEVCAVITAPPSGQAAARRTLLEHKAGQPAWIAASQQLRRKAPQLAACAADLWREFDTWPAQQGQLAKLRLKQVSRQPAVVVRDAARPNQESTFPYWVIPIAIAILTAVRNCDQSRLVTPRSSTPYRQTERDRAERLQRDLERLMKDKEALQRPEHEAIRRLLGVPKESSADSSTAPNARSSNPDNDLLLSPEPARP